MDAQGHIRSSLEEVVEELNRVSAQLLQPCIDDVAMASPITPDFNAQVFTQMLQCQSALAHAGASISTTAADFEEHFPFPGPGLMQNVGEDPGQIVFHGNGRLYVITLELGARFGGARVSITATANGNEVDIEVIKMILHPHGSRHTMTYANSIRLPNGVLVREVDGPHAYPATANEEGLINIEIPVLLVPNAEAE